MLPFARMLRYGDVDKVLVLDIDFERQNIGDTGITDFTGNSTFMLASGTTAGVVEYNSTIQSNVMKFNSSRYDSMMNAFLTLPGNNFEIQIVLNNNSSAVGEIICTGDYNGARIPGMNLNNNRGANNYGLFLDNGSTYETLFFGAVPNTGWNTVIFRYDSSGITCTVNGVKSTFPSRTFGTGTKFAIGGSYTGGSPVYWNGYLKSIKLLRI